MAHFAQQNSDWVNQQLQMFKDWANSILKKRDMAIHGLLTEDVSDGVALINILEIATGQSVGRYHKNPHFPGHKLDNISVAIRFIEKNLGGRVHCTPNVILEGNVQQVLGLFFVVHRIVTQLPDPSTLPPPAATQTPRKQEPKVEEPPKETKQPDQAKVPEEKSEPESVSVPEEKVGDSTSESVPKEPTVVEPPQVVKIPSPRPVEPEPQKVPSPRPVSPRPVSPRPVSPRQPTVEPPQPDPVPSPRKPDPEPEVPTKIASPRIEPTPSPDPVPSPRKPEPEPEIQIPKIISPRPQSDSDQSRRQKTVEPDQTKPNPKSPRKKDTLDTEGKSDPKSPRRKETLEPDHTKTNPKSPRRKETLETDPTKTNPKSPRSTPRKHHHEKSDQPTTSPEPSTPEIQPLDLPKHRPEDPIKTPTSKSARKTESLKADETKKKPKKDAPVPPRKSESARTISTAEKHAHTQPTPEPHKPEEPQEPESPEKTPEEFTGFITSGKLGTPNLFNIPFSQSDSPARTKPVPPPKPKPLPQRPPTGDLNKSPDLSAKPRTSGTLSDKPKKKTPNLPLGGLTDSTDSSDRPTGSISERSKKNDEWVSPRTPQIPQHDVVGSRSPREEPPSLVTKSDSAKRSRPTKAEALMNPLLGRASTLPVKRTEETEEKKPHRTSSRQSKSKESLDGIEEVPPSPKGEKKDKSRAKRTSEILKGTQPLEAMTLGRKSGRDKTKDKGERSGSRRKGSVSEPKRSDSTGSPAGVKLTSSDAFGSISGKRQTGSKTHLPKLFTKESASEEEKKNAASTTLSSEGLTEEQILEEKLQAEKRLAELVTNFQAAPQLLARLQAVFRGKLSRKFPDKIVKEYNRRHHIANEIFSTELFYVQCLEYTNDKYRLALSNLKDADDQPVCSPASIKTIFATVQIILNINKKLLEFISARMSKWFSEGCRMGDIFSKHGPTLKFYIAYVNSYDQAMSQLRQLSANELVKAELEKCRVDAANPKTLDLPSLLIMPIQRLPRYVLLLQDLLAHTPATHADHADLTKALDGVVALASEVNLKKKTSDNVAAVALITSRLQPENSFKSSSSSIYINQGPINCYEAMDPKTNELIKINLNDLGTHKFVPTNWKQHYIFLFNDNLIFSTPAPQEQQAAQPVGLTGQAFGAGAGLLRGIRDKIWTSTDLMKTWTIEELREHSEMLFRFSTNIELRGMELLDTIDRQDSHIFALAPRGSKDARFIFSCPDAATKKQWVTDLDNALWTLMFNERTRSSNQHPLAKSADKHKKKAVVSMTGGLHINQTAKPDSWCKKHGVIRGTNLILYENENDFLSESKNNKPKVTEIPLASVDVLLWPPPGVVTFLDFEKSDDLDSAEELFKNKFIDMMGPNKNLPLPVLEKKLKYYFSIDKIVIDGVSHCWYFSVGSPEQRMAWINKLRQAIHKTYS